MKLNAIKMQMHLSAKALWNDRKVCKNNYRDHILATNMQKM